MLQSLALIKSSADMDVELASAPRSTTGNVAYMVQLAALHTRYDSMCYSTCNPVLFPLNSVIKNSLSSALQISELNPSYKILKERGCRVLSCQSGKKYTYTLQKLGYSWLKRRTWSPWSTWIPWSTW